MKCHYVLFVWSNLVILQRNVIIHSVKTVATEWLFNSTCPMCRKEFYHISEEEKYEIEEINRLNEILRPKVYVYPRYKVIINAKPFRMGWI